MDFKSDKRNKGCMRFSPTIDISLMKEAGIDSTSKYTILPGFCDVHVHFREPGFSYKETIATGTKAAARGGFTSVCTMPNLNPVSDSVENLRLQQRIINKDANIFVYPYAAITIDQSGKELADLEALADKCIAFSDDGHGVQSEDMMREAMLKAKSLDKIIVAHCEDNSLLKGGYIHDGKYAAEHGHKGICSESEWKQVERDVRLVAETKCSYHVCHISCKETVDIIRKAKQEGIDVTCETALHYLLLDDSMLEEDGRWKMNPPIRDASDREALIEGLKDGTIDCLATDHAPHSAEEKSRGLEKSAFGIVGIETAFPIAYTYLVKAGIISMERLLELMVYNPRRRFNIPLGNDYSVWDLSEEWTVDPEEFLSKGKATPFAGWKVYGKNYLTVCDGKEAYR
ncbi:MAG TPA: dihydroorotase [Mogibacterium sp.]|nr:dihydroorotase [Mogibacterium sp.]